MRLPTRGIELASVVVAVLVIADVSRASSPAVSPSPSQASPDGFRLEGTPKLDEVFGDVNELVAYMDNFTRKTNTMASNRRDFYATVTSGLAALARSRYKRCPPEAAAVINRAEAKLTRFQALGRELQRAYERAAYLLKLGESTGLPARYRLRVPHLATHYDANTRDHQEMRFALAELYKELRAGRCRTNQLRRQSTAMLAEPIRGAVNPPYKPPSWLKPPKDNFELPRDDVATFFIDNRECATPVLVFLDGKRTTEVSGRTRHPIQTAAGYHTICLASGALGGCTTAQEVRSTYIHDGWALRLRCATAP